MIIIIKPEEFTTKTEKWLDNFLEDFPLGVATEAILLDTSVKSYLESDKVLKIRIDGKKHIHYFALEEVTILER